MPTSPYLNADSSSMYLPSCILMNGSHILSLPITPRNSMLRRFAGKSCKAIAPMARAVAPMRAMSHHVEVPKDLPEGFPFEVLPHKLGNGERKIVMGPMTPVPLALYPIEENPDKNPAIEFILDQNGEVIREDPILKRAIGVFLGAVLTVAALELTIVGGIHTEPEEVTRNREALYRRDAIYGSQYEKTWAELRAEEKAAEESE